MFGLFSKRFTPLETAVLNSLAENLNPDARRILNRQLLLVKKTERAPPDHGEVLFRPGKDNLEGPAYRFPNESVELKFARVTFKCPGIEGKWNADFWMAGGHFFIINFSPGVKRIQHTDKIDVTSFKLLEDPMISSTKPGGTPVIIVPHEIAVWYGPLKRGDYVQANAPLDPARKIEVLEGIDASLPGDYLEMSQWCNGWDTSTFNVMGLTDVYEISLPQGSFYVLAVNPDGVLAVKEGSRDGRVYLAAYDGMNPEDFGVTFKEALHKFETR